VHVELSGYLPDGGLEDLVARYGPGRLLFASGWPRCYMGAAMLHLAGADLDADAKAAIAGGNLARLLEEVRL
jgi:hypothetical protein